MSHQFAREFASLDEAFLAVMDLLLRQGTSSAPRDLPTREVAPFTFSISNPRRRFVSIPERKWSIAYAIAEFAWHLRGADSVDEIAFYAPRWRTIARGKSKITGSCYGARVFAPPHSGPSQWETMLALLRRDVASRRAVLHFSEPNANPLDSDADIACALSLQLILRNDRLDAICTMRSNDAVLGMPYDVFLFTMMQEMAATALGCELGRYHHQVGSLHLYESQIAVAERVVGSRPAVIESMTPMSDLHDAAKLLEGEARSRLGVDRLPGSFEDSGYWTDLLEVIESWTKRREGATIDAAPPKLRDPVLDALFAQWRSTQAM
jgi:thymidylate synthase